MLESAGGALQALLMSFLISMIIVSVIMFGGWLFFGVAITSAVATAWVVKLSIFLTLIKTFQFLMSGNRT